MNNVAHAAVQTSRQASRSRGAADNQTSEAIRQNSHASGSPNEPKMAAIDNAQRERPTAGQRRQAPERKTLEFPGFSAPQNRT